MYFPIKITVPEYRYARQNGEIRLCFHLEIEFATIFFDETTIFKIKANRIAIAIKFDIVSPAMKAKGSAKKCPACSEILFCLLNLSPSLYLIHGRHLGE